jgi:hypothetical protein
MKRWATVRWAARIVALRKGGMGAMASALPRSPHSARLFVARPGQRAARNQALRRKVLNAMAPDSAPQRNGRSSGPASVSRQARGSETLLEVSMTIDLIVDQETGKIVATMRGGEVFRHDGEGARIAIVLNDYLYDLHGGLIGHLKGRHVIDANTRSMPIEFRKLLEGNSRKLDHIAPARRRSTGRDMPARAAMASAQTSKPEAPVEAIR